MSSESPRAFLSTREVAELLDVNEKVVYSLISEKGLPASKVTGKWIFPRHLVEAWIDSHMINYPSRAGMSTADDPLIIAGSNDPLLERTIALFNSRFPEHLCVFGPTGSLGGLRALNCGRCHMATSHLMHGDEQEYNFQYLAEHIQGPLPVVVNFCFREQGLIVAPGNPKKIGAVSDLARPGIRLANRPEGTGTRLLLEHELRKADIDPAGIEGFGREFPTHLAVAFEVLAGRADVGMGIRAVASLLGLDFVAVRRERYDFLVSRELFFERSIQRFLGLLQESDFRLLVETFQGYDMRLCGRITYPGD